MMRMSPSPSSIWRPRSAGIAEVIAATPAAIETDTVSV